eukprot:scaffold270158_cov32-Tisochrysis_lutea.AAC.1
MDGDMLVDLSPPKHSVWKVGLVGRIGKVLRLEAEAGVPVVFGAVASRELAVQVVASIKLDPGLVCAHSHPPARLWLPYARARAQAIFWIDGRGEHIVMVVAHTVVRVLEPTTDCNGLGQVHCPCGTADLAGRDRSSVNRGVQVRGQLNLVIDDGTQPAIAQVPICVICQIDRRRRIAHRLVLHLERRRSRKGICHLGDDCSWIALVAILGAKRQRDRGVRLILANPVPLIKTFGPAVEMVCPIVGGKLILLVVQHKLASCNAVGVPPSNAAKVRARA